MATPMILPLCCAICFEPYGEGTFDLDDDGGSVALILVNVCSGCRWWETRQLILKRSAYPEETA